MQQTLYAEKVEITSISMRAENMKKEVHFIDDVHIKQGDDWLNADRVIVYFDENNETKMYEAIGSVTFEFKDEKSAYNGSADRVKYYPVKSLYILTDNAMIDDLVNKSHIAGDEIILDMIKGHATVKSTKKKPVKFIIEMEEKK